MSHRLTVALAVALALAGCGLGPGRTPGDVQLTVTRHFGAQALISTRTPRMRGQETVMSLLMRNSAVSTRYGGGFVQSIDGLAGGSERGDPVDWLYYVNGVQAPAGAAETVVRSGDRIWWDLHDWSQAEEVPAVVGSFPQPFLSGIEGRRVGVRVECALPSSAPCRAALGRLRAAGARATSVALSGRAPGPAALRVLVGTFAAIAAREPGVRQLEQGPRASGVYARFARDGRALTLLDERGRAVRTLTAGAGLVVATRAGQAPPVWALTGTDVAGVRLAVQALSEASLRDRFALALTAGAAVALPSEDSLARSPCSHPLVAGRCRSPVAALSVRRCAAPLACARK